MLGPSLQIANGTWFFILWALANHFWAHRAQTCHCVGSKTQSNGSSMLVTWMANGLTNTWWKINHLVHIFCLIIPGVTAEIVLTGWCPSFPWSQPFSYNSIQINKDHNLVQLLKFCWQHLWFFCSDMAFINFPHAIMQCWPMLIQAVRQTILYF